ncbi:nucleoside monophosphate kinase, partial [Streptomyces albidoflavus]
LGKQAKSYMDAGNLVPDEVTIGMAEDRMAQPDAENGFLLDGFPRNVSQAKALDESLKAQGVALDAVLDLEVPEDEVVKRIAGRRICRNDSSHVFHVEYSKPETEGVCDVCGGELYQRADDKEETVRKRLEVYHNETEPIIDHYKAQGLVVTISALGKVDEVTARAMAALGADQK